MFTKTEYVPCLSRLRNSVLNNLTHSHGFDFTYRMTIPSALSPSQISPWNRLTMKCFHLQVSNLTGLKMSSPYYSHWALKVVPASAPRPRPGTGGCPPSPCSSHARVSCTTSHIPISSPSPQTLPRHGPFPQGLLGSNILHSATKWPR